MLSESFYMFYSWNFLSWNLRFIIFPFVQKIFILILNFVEKEELFPQHKKCLLIISIIKFHRMLFIDFIWENKVMRK